LNVIDVNYVQ